MMSDSQFVREYVAVGEQRRAAREAAIAAELATVDGATAPQIDARIASPPSQDLPRDEAEYYAPPARRGLKLKDMPSDEMPREKMAELGPQALTESELLAILLGSGTTKVNVKDLALDLLSRFEDLQTLSRASMASMMNCNGIGLAKSSQLAAAFEVARRLQSRPGLPGQTYGGPSSSSASLAKPHAIAEFMQPLLAHKPQEELWVIYLSKRYRYRGKSQVYVGHLDRIDISPGVVLSGVVERREPCFTIVHNHPSGDSEPSTSDIATTKRLVRAAKELGLHLVDHVIVAASGYTSLRMSRMVEFE